MLKVVPLLIALSAASAGCCSCYTGSITEGWDLFTNSFRNLSEEPVRYVDDVTFTMHSRRLANDAWRKVYRDSPDQHYSLYYAEGFKAGFTDYLDAGGCAEPPAAPPFCFQLSCYRNPPGVNAIQDWYAGFRHGATVAQMSGLRELIVVPLSAVPMRPTSSSFAEIPHSGQPSSSASGSQSKESSASRRPGKLPAPREIVPLPELPGELPPPSEVDPAPPKTPRWPFDGPWLEG